LSGEPVIEARLEVCELPASQLGTDIATVIAAMQSTEPWPRNKPVIPARVEPFVAGTQADPWVESLHRQDMHLDVDTETQIAQRATRAWTGAALTDAARQRPNPVGEIDARVKPRREPVAGGIDPEGHHVRDVVVQKTARSPPDSRPPPSSRAAGRIPCGPRARTRSRLQGATPYPHVVRGRPPAAHWPVPPDRPTSAWRKALRRGSPEPRERRRLCDGPREQSYHSERTCDRPKITQRIAAFERRLLPPLRHLVADLA